MQITRAQKIMMAISLRDMSDRNGARANYYQGLIWYWIGFGLHNGD